MTGHIYTYRGLIQNLKSTFFFVSQEIITEDDVWACRTVVTDVNKSSKEMKEVCNERTVKGYFSLVFLSFR